MRTKNEHKRVKKLLKVRKMSSVCSVQSLKVYRYVGKCSIIQIDLYLFSINLHDWIYWSINETKDIKASENKNAILVFAISNIPTFYALRMNFRGRFLHSIIPKTSEMKNFFISDILGVIESGKKLTAKVHAKCIKCCGV